MTYTITAQDEYGTQHVIFASSDAQARVVYDELKDDCKALYRDGQHENTTMVYLVTPESNAYEVMFGMFVLLDNNIGNEEVMHAMLFIRDA